jgi:hypothetical protein
VDVKMHNFRGAIGILEGKRHSWNELITCIDSITREQVIDAQEELAAARSKRPRGGQTAINSLLRDTLSSLGWQKQPALFPHDRPELRHWKLDFLKDGIGVDVSFNHQEAIPWTFTRLSVARESHRVFGGHRIDVGVAIFATASAKRWARMDGAVGTYELATAWLNEMEPITPAPILVIGLDEGAWLPVSESVFPGTGRTD